MIHVYNVSKFGAFGSPSELQDSTWTNPPTPPTPNHCSLIPSIWLYFTLRVLFFHSVLQLYLLTQTPCLYLRSLVGSSFSWFLERETLQYLVSLFFTKTCSCLFIYWLAIEGLELSNWMNLVGRDNKDGPISINVFRILSPLLSTFFSSKSQRVSTVDFTCPCKGLFGCLVKFGWLNAEIASPQNPTWQSFSSICA